MRCVAWIVTAMLIALGTPARGADMPDAPAPLRFHDLRSADGIPLNVVESGNPGGRPVMFLHGAYQSYLSWLGQLRDPALTRELRLIAPDLRGHGGSGKPWDPAAYAGSRPWADDVQSVMAQLRVEKPLLVGWSFGGYVVMDYIREYGSSDIAGAVLVGSHGGLLPRLPGAGNRPPAADGNLETLRQGARDFAAVMAVRPQPVEVLDRTESAFLMTPAYARRAMAGKRLDNSDLGSRLTLPLLFIVGSEDAIVMRDDLRATSQGLPGAHYIVYAGIGHSPFIEDVARFNADLRCFIATLDPCLASNPGHRE